MLLLGAAGDAVGSVIGIKLRRRAFETRFKTADAVGGSALSVSALILAIWFLGINLAAGPFPSVARALQRSAVVRVVDAALPPPPVLAAQLGNVLDIIGFPDIFAGLPPLPADPVPQPHPGTRGAERPETRGRRWCSSSGPACDEILQGTGFVVADDLVLTNAHVIAGGSPRVEWDGQTFDAVPVLFDDDLDAAILRVDGLDAPALTLLTERWRGAPAAPCSGTRTAATRSSARRLGARWTPSAATSIPRTASSGGSTSSR